MLVTGIKTFCLDMLLFIISLQNILDYREFKTLINWGGGWGRQEIQSRVHTIIRLKNPTFENHTKMLHDNSCL